MGSGDGGTAQFGIRFCIHLCLMLFLSQPCCLCVQWDTRITVVYMINSPHVGSSNSTKINAF